LSEADWLERARRYCFQGRLDRRQTEGPVFSHGSGSVVVDVEGKEYLDFNSGQMCSALGHNHPRIVAAIAEALETMIHANSTYYNVQEIALAERLAGTLPAPLRKSFFALSGSDANEAAIGMAKKVTGRYEVASPHVSFHGLSDTPRAVTFAGWRSGLAPTAPGSFAMLAPYCYRCPVRHTFPACGIACLDASLELLDAETAEGLAAVITEPLFSAGGVIEPPPGWLAQTAAEARARGALFVLDEAQTGLAKLGTMWAFEQEGVVPDILTISKHFGGGISISAVVTTEEIEEQAIAGGYSYAHSHSNDPLACAAALATLEAIEEERLADRALEIGARLRSCLEELQARHDAIGDIRGRGILQGIELVRPDGSPATELGEPIRRACLREGLLFSVRRNGSVLRFVPPFSTTAEQVDRATEILDVALAEARATAAVG
jgi:2,2-dialkylglycine decarboxylase (pyruvate)